MAIYKSSFFAILFIAAHAINTPAKACFNDLQLDISMRPSQGNPGSLLYVWSPRMVLSATQAHLAADAAKAAGLKFVPLVDGRLPVTEWQSALRTLAASQPEVAEALATTEPLCSPKLVEKDAYTHFPTAFVAKSGELHPNRLIGAMPAQFWAQGIHERMKPRNDGAAFQEPQQCIPQNQFIALDPALAGLNDDKQVALGAYERISPDGRYILRSFSGSKLSAVSLVEIPGPPGLSAIKGQLSRQKIVSTPFSNEAFPVQGSWRYLVDTNGDHYTFHSIIIKKNNDHSATKPLFSGGMDGFYAAASEVNTSYPERNEQPVNIRSLSWPNANATSTTSEVRQGEGMLTSRTLTVEKHKIIADSRRVNLCLDRLREDGTMYALPMISVDGKEFAALPQSPVAGVPTMRIFGFGADGKQCEPRGQFTLQSGKVIFGFTNKTKKQADVAYEYRGQVWWVRRDDSLKSLVPLNLGPWEDPAFKPTKGNPAFRDVTASAFPGFTRDGRIIYAASWRRCGSLQDSACVQEAGYVVSDPYQSNAYRNELRQTQAVAHKSCITVHDVAHERAVFSAFHGTD
jgi:hypothetical protein